MPRPYRPNTAEVHGRMLYVAQNHPDASDTNPGTSDLPLKTISRAALMADMGDTVLIDEGTYREEVPITKQGHQFMPEGNITFRAVFGKEVYLKGSDVLQTTWTPTRGVLHKARLPEYLFAANAYNPYELNCAVDDPGKVRPVSGASPWAKTLGQIYVDGEPLEQMDALEEVERRPNTFIVSADGREIIVHFAENRIPGGKLIELTVRRRCFDPAVRGQLHIETVGMVVDHAAEPEAFSLVRPYSVRRNAENGITVCKRPLVVNRSFYYGYSNQISYVGRENPALIGSFLASDYPEYSSKCTFYNALSTDHGKSWQPISNERYSINRQTPFQYFLDEQNNVLLRYYHEYAQLDLDQGFGEAKHGLMLQMSRDGGRDWTAPQRIDAGSWSFRIEKLDTGELLWPYTRNKHAKGSYFSVLHTRLGRWREDRSLIDWSEGGSLEADPQMSAEGLDEPRVCQLPDGRIFAIFRQMCVLPRQNQPGFPSVKLYSVSEDRGRSWSPAKPLTFEDGQYIYSGGSYPDVFRSQKNNRVYLLVNISPEPTYGCDPRTTLHIMELDPETLCVKRKSVAIIETKHPEHHYLTRFSNWQILPDRESGNLLLFMRLELSEYCPIRKGYDFRTFRYEIALDG